MKVKAYAVLKKYTRSNVALVDTREDEVFGRLTAPAINIACKVYQMHDKTRQLQVDRSRQ